MPPSIEDHIVIWLRFKLSVRGFKRIRRLGQHELWQRDDQRLILPLLRGYVPDTVWERLLSLAPRIR